jgi:hypothetical protein
MLMIAIGSATVVALHNGGNAVYAKVKATSVTTASYVGPCVMRALTPQGAICDKFAQFRNATKLTNAQLITLLHTAGFKGHELKVAWAVVMKESRGHPLSHNKNRSTGDNSYGLFQINMIDNLGAARREKLGLKSNAVLLDPVTNVKAAYHMTNGGKNWSAWTGSTAKALTVAKWVRIFPNHAMVNY